MKKTTWVLASLFFTAGVAQAQQDETERIQKRIQKQVEKAMEQLKKLGESAEKWLKDVTKKWRERKRMRPEPPMPPRTESSKEVPKSYRHDAWEAWNSVGVGSSVSFEIETAGIKMKVVKVLDRKGADKHTLKTETFMKVGDNETETPGEEPVPKAMTWTLDAKANCPLCTKPFRDHKDAGRWSDEILRVGGKDLPCKRYDSPAKNCKGDEQMTSTIWYCTDVPGHLVKMETAQMKMSLVAFEKK